MKQRIRWLPPGILFTQTIQGQSETGQDYRNFPIVLGVRFHSLSSPSEDVKPAFKNIGFGIGSEIAMGSKHNRAQQSIFIKCHKSLKFQL